MADRSRLQKHVPSAGSDLENSFFRAWALRGSEGSNATETSQRGSTSSTPPSPLSSFTQYPDRKPRLIDGDKYYSESDLPTPLPDSPYWSTRSVQESPPTLQEESPPTNSPSGGSITETSVGAKARQILGFPDRQTLSSSTKEGRPHRNARQGFRWSRAAPGFWIEVRIGREKDSSPASSKTEATARRAYTTGHSADYDDDDSVLGIETHSQTTTRPLMGNDSPAQRSISPIWTETPTDSHLLADPFQEGVYCRTKRALGLKTGPITAVDHSPRTPERAMTGDVASLLDKTSNALRYLKSKGREPTTSSTTTSNLSIASPRSAIHWQHLRPSLTRSKRSSSSSIRSLMRGKPPPSTPEPRDMYTGSDKNQYVSVELTYPDGPTFLPSEARRIKTPPMGSPSIASTNMRRGFYFNNSPLQESERAFPPRPNSTTVSTVSSGSQATSISTLPTQIPDKQRQHSAASVHRRISETGQYWIGTPPIEEGMTREEFVLSVPEHLPNSPMCPRHPKHKSGGKGVCIYHGRNMTSDPHTTPPEKRRKSDDTLLVYN